MAKADLEFISMCNTGKRHVQRGAENSGCVAQRRGSGAYHGAVWCRQSLRSLCRVPGTDPP